MIKLGDISKSKVDVANKRINEIYHHRIWLNVSLNTRMLLFCVSQLKAAIGRK